MKSIISICIILTLVTLTINAGLKTQKTDTVLGFFNDMFLENQVLPTAPVQNTTVIAEGNSTMLSEWLSISSNQFTNKVKFPPVMMPDGTEKIIQTDKDFFRINGAFSIMNKDINYPQTTKDFWFRLSGSHLYYSSTKLDMNVIGAISIDSIRSAESKEDSTLFPFIINDVARNRWTLYAKDEHTRKVWICAVQTELGLKPEMCLPQLLATITPLEITVIEQKIIQPIILIPIASKQCNAEWTYLNQGSDWECGCADGTEQSPIDLPDFKKATDSPVSPVFQYEEAEAKSPLTTVDGHIKANEFIKIKYFANNLRIFHPNFGKIVTLDGAVYVAEEIVFHTPSEHTIDGKRYDMEMQIIHYGQTRGDIAKQVVLSILFHKKPGVYNKFLDDVDLFSLPNSLFKERDITNNLFIPKVFYSSTDEDIPVMKPFSFYTYQGSLTSPPCTERTIHYVASEPIAIASASLQLIQEALRIPDMQDDKGNFMVNNNDTPTNYREVQPNNERPVFFYDHTKYCELDTVQAPKKVKAKGHYERVSKKATQYYFVNSIEPSGLPGSFVVDENEAKGIITKKLN